MKKITTLKTWPLYIFLLPVFFVLHGVKEHFGFIYPKDFIPLILLYCGVSLFIFSLLYAIYRKVIKAGLVTFLILSIHFFFGSLQDFLQSFLPAINRYSILLPALFILLVVTAVLVKRSSKKFERLNFYLNCLLLIYILFDVIGLTAKLISPPKDKFSTYSFTKDNTYTSCDTCTKPDIYLLVFDEYASSLNLKENFSFDNSELDSFLVSKKFRIQQQSAGNYNFTPFSVSSILNMSYIDGINKDWITIEDYARCNNLIRDNEVCKYLSSIGYNIVNYSIFDIAGNPSPIDQDFLPLKTKLITDGTLWGRAKKQVLWNVLAGRFEIKWLTNNMVYAANNNNNLLLDLVKKESAKKETSPKFVYAHYNMPHPPYYFDRHGKAVGKEKLDPKNDADKSMYLEYIQYTNKKIEELISSIQANTSNNAVIIMMGDHGFRYDKKMQQKVFMQNQNAVYIPAQISANPYYDTITGVNQFRVLLNTLFKQKMPVLKDSSIFLTDSK